MATVIEESDPISTLILIVGAALIFGAIVTVITSHSADVKKAHETPCAVYEQLPLDKVPARCITPEGGFTYGH